MAGGEIEKNPAEAGAVAVSYESYLRGDSYLAIANAMSGQGLRYHEASAGWNKHMVKRMLENPKYAGQDEYPAIVSRNIWNDVQDMRDRKMAGNKSQPVCIAMVKRRIICGECGSVFSKDTHMTASGNRWWHCSNPECSHKFNMKDSGLEETMTAILNRLIMAPELLDLLQPAEQPAPLEAVRMQNEINRELNRAEADEEDIITLILGCAAEKYAMLDDGAEKKKIAGLKADLQNWPLLTAFDPALFSDAVQAVLVMVDGTLALRIIGGNIITENERST
jgi:hypothetical protein